MSITLLFHLCTLRQQTVIPLVDLMDEPDAVIPNENLCSDINCQSDRGTDGDHGNTDPIDETNETSLLLQQTY